MMIQVSTKTGRATRIATSAIRKPAPLLVDVETHFLGRDPKRSVRLLNNSQTSAHRSKSATDLRFRLCNSSNSNQQQLPGSKQSMPPDLGTERQAPNSCGEFAVNPRSGSEHRSVAECRAAMEASRPDPRSDFGLGSRREVLGPEALVSIQPAIHQGAADPAHTPAVVQEQETRRQR